MGSPENMILFSPGSIGPRRAPNRIVSQAMEGNDGVDGGRPSERTLERYRNLARGGWGTVVVEALSVSPSSLARKNGLVITERNTAQLAGLVQEFKKLNPEGLLLFQLTHSGAKSGNFSRVVSLTPDPPEGVEYLSTEEIEEIRKDFIRAVRIAEEVGADGVDFKLCHGYFGAEMLRPSNTRPDRWGGSFENRTRFLRESMEEIAGMRTRKDFIIGSRISLYEAIRGGCGTAGPDELTEDLSEMREVIRLMDRLGMDYVNVSAGIPGVTSEVTRPTRPSKNFFLHHFRYTGEAKRLGTGLTVIGSAYTILGEEAHLLAEENLRKGCADFIGFGRQSFADPFYPARLIAGEKINYCIACSGCTKLMVNQVHDGCMIYDDYYRQMAKSMRSS